MNLAALEVVDYVIIDDNATPLENIQYLQPDYFAKGYEYGRGGHASQDAGGDRGPRELRRRDDLHAGRRRLLVLAIIESEPPNLAVGKAAAADGGRGHHLRRLRQALATLSGIEGPRGRRHHRRFLHLLLADRRAAAKTPTFSVKYDRADDFAGGAAVVAKHLRAAGAEVLFSTVLGDDALKDLRAARTWSRAAFGATRVIDQTRPTTQKNVFIADGYRMLKVDTLDNRPISEQDR